MQQWRFHKTLMHYLAVCGKPHIYMISKIVIPAAGKGTRMLDLAKNKPKHLINVLDKPFLYYVLKNLQNSGFEEMILIIGHHAEKMEEFARQHENEFNITLIDQFKTMGTEK